VDIPSFQRLHFLLSLGGVEAVKVLAIPRWVLVSGAWDQSIYGSVEAPWGW